jgi:glucosyl-3-phosphoglycerate synthase
MKQFSTVLRQFQAQNEKYEQIEHEIVEEERPPMNTLPEYREKFGKEYISSKGTSSTG